MKLTKDQYSELDFAYSTSNPTRKPWTLNTIGNISTKYRKVFEELEKMGFFKDVIYYDGYDGWTNIIFKRTIKGQWFYFKKALSIKCCY